MRPIYDAQFRGEIRKRMSPPSRETVTEISRATGISRQTLYSWRHLWKREGELVPASSSSTLLKQKTGFRTVLSNLLNLKK